jgi:hypothetical protein
MTTTLPDTLWAVLEQPLHSFREVYDAAAAGLPCQSSSSASLGARLRDALPANKRPKAPVFCRDLIREAYSSTKDALQMRGLPGDVGPELHIFVCSREISRRRAGPITPLKDEEAVKNTNVKELVACAIEAACQVTSQSLSHTSTSSEPKIDLAIIREDPFHPSAPLRLVVFEYTGSGVADTLEDFEACVSIAEIGRPFNYTKRAGKAESVLVKVCLAL